MIFLRAVSVFLLLIIFSGCSFPMDSYTPFSRELPPTATIEELLTQEDAKLIALHHAKAPEADTRGLQISFEYDDGIPRYDVSFIFMDFEYEYEIHGISGRIISYEREGH